MKKRHLLALLPLLCLTSCGKDTYTGTYKFMLGKEGDLESQIGLSMELLDDNFTYKVFNTIVATVSTHKELDDYDKTYLEDKQVIKVLSDTDEKTHFYIYDANNKTFSDNGTERPYKETKDLEGAKTFDLSMSIGKSLGSLPEKISIAILKGMSGFYKPTTYVDEKYGTRMAIGTVISEEHVRGMEDIYSYITDQSSQAVADLLRRVMENSELTRPDIVEYILTSYISSKSLTIKIPVSLTDLQHQFAWYGIYVDFAEEIKSKIHSLSDVLEHLTDILTTFKYYDLTKHHEKITGKPTSEGKIVEMPGTQGEARFGTLPNKTVDSKGYSEVDYMNKYYANEFSNTYSYSEEKGSKVGAITSWSKEAEEQTIYYYYDRDNLITDKTPYLETYLLFANEYDSYDTYKKVIINFDHSETDPNLGVKISNIVLADKPTEIISFSGFYKEPFTFRNFHTLALSLSK